MIGGEDSLHVAVATLRADHAALDRRVSGIETDFRKDLSAKHKENRLSIHALRNSQQDIIDLIHNLDLKFAKFTGYAIGAGAAITIFMKLLDHLWK